MSALLRAPAYNGGHECSLADHCLFQQVCTVVRQVTGGARGESKSFALVEALLANFDLHEGQQDAHEFQQALFDCGVSCELLHHNKPFFLQSARRSDDSNRHHTEFGLAQTTRLAQLVNVHVRMATADQAGHLTSVLSVNYGLSLELRWAGGQASSVQEALAHFVEPEPVQLKCQDCSPHQTITVARGARVDAASTRAVHPSQALSNKRLWPTKQNK